MKKIPTKKREMLNSILVDWHVTDLVSQGGSSRLQDSHHHQFSCWNTNTQIHKYTNTQIQMHKYKYTSSNTQIQMYKYKYTNNDSYMLTRSRGGVLRGLPARQSSPEVETGEFFHHYLSPSLFTITSRYQAQKGPRLRDFSIGQGQDIFGLQTHGC